MGISYTTQLVHYIIDKDIPHELLLTLFFTRIFSSTSWRGEGGAQRPLPANSGPIWATNNPKTVLESSEKMSFGL